MPSEEIEKFRIIESRKNYEAADQWLRNFAEATWDEVRTFVRFYCPPGDEMLSLLRDCREWEAAKLKPCEVDDTPSGRLEDDLSVAMAQFRGSLDFLSLVGSTIRPLDYTESLSWNILAPDYFLAPFDHQGVSGGFLTDTGRPRSGKTGIACLYAEMWLWKYPGTEVLTNIPMERTENPLPGIVPVTTMTPLLQGIARALNAGRRWMWQFDEPSLSRWMKSDAPTTQAKNLERFARIIPKLGGSFIYIEQREEGVPTTIQDFSQSHIYCTNPGNVFADLPGKRMPIRHVPKPSRIKYRTGEAGFFEVAADFPWEKLFRALRYDPFLNQIEDVDATTQGTRIESFLSTMTTDAMTAKGVEVRCRECGYEWELKGGTRPAQCPKCRSRRWDTEEKEPPSRTNGRSSA